MSDKFQGAEKNGASSEELRAEVERLMEHMRTHNPQDCQFAIAMFGHSDGVEDENGQKDLHVCSLIGGAPPMIARAVTELISELVKRDPMFALYLLKSLMEDVSEARQRIVEEKLEEKLEEKFGQTGDEKTKATVTDILSRINNNGSIH